MATDERANAGSRGGKLFAANKHRTGVTAMMAVDPRRDWRVSRDPLEKDRHVADVAIGESRKGVAKVGE